MAQGGKNSTRYRLQLTSLSYFGLLTYIFELGQLIRMAMLRDVAALFKVSTKNFHIWELSQNPDHVPPLVMIDEETFVHALWGKFLVVLLGTIIEFFN
jgi:hypothetical protein